MQFQPPSQPSWGQPELDPFNSRVQQPQQPSYTQPGQYQQPQFFQQVQQTPQPVQQPLRQPLKAQQKPVNKKVGIGCGVVAVVLVLIIAISVAAQGGANNSSSSSSSSSSNSTTPAAQTTSASDQSTPVDQPTTPDENFGAIKPTHGTPFIGGQISDFLGKYGTPATINQNDASWFLNADGSLILVARDTGGGKVEYLALVTPDNWSQQQIQTYCLGFAPAEYTYDHSSDPYNAQGLYVYNSPSGKFAIHLGQANCWMNPIN